ncbi:GNAT family N-acetyltransferase [Bacillus sp. B-jedd]|uniref:GNAT family N-acetyltransferase n=1 Tax=Bacillus sp. B-jedd TaxID=1476857 RepID=UPI0005156492|nr:GNAT family N-acetyltransferase [Bacillus sp. B-jedd]CEG26569.1 GCN5-like N-acetyltransferase [Bacillus sp. B-jedd]
MAFVFAKDYRDNDVLRKSLSRLAETIFGIQFEEWHSNGYWTDKYIPYSFCDGEEVIANISVNKIQLVINGIYKDALQIGTVMTHPGYRGRGLSRTLMEYILEDFDGKYDVIYLFANETVLGYYPKFGFREAEESIFSVSYSGKSKGGLNVQKLDMECHADRAFLYNFAKERIPVSSVFASAGTAELLMFYCLNVFRDMVFYLKDEECIVIYSEQGEELHLYDLVSKSEVDLKPVLAELTGSNKRNVIFHFTPQLGGFPFAIRPFKGSETLFIRFGRKFILPARFKHPVTSQA